MLLFALCVFPSCDRCRFGCKNGTCVERVCHCESFWEGDACERSYLARYAGTYSGTNPCLSGHAQTFVLATSPSDPSQMVVDAKITLSFTDSSRFDILPQPFEGHTITGEGQVQVERISFYYEWSDSTVVSRCLVEGLLD